MGGTEIPSIIHPSTKRKMIRDGLQSKETTEWFPFKWLIAINSDHVFLIHSIYPDFLSTERATSFHILVHDDDET